jgi:hypothetical protein
VRLPVGRPINCEFRGFPNNQSADSSAGMIDCPTLNSARQGANPLPIDFTWLMRHNAGSRSVSPFPEAPLAEWSLPPELHVQSRPKIFHSDCQDRLGSYRGS